MNAWESLLSTNQYVNSCSLVSCYSVIFLDLSSTGLQKPQPTRHRSVSTLLCWPVYSAGGSGTSLSCYRATPQWGWRRHENTHSYTPATFCLKPQKGYFTNLYKPKPNLIWTPPIGEIWHKSCWLRVLEYENAPNMKQTTDYDNWFDALSFGSLALFWCFVVSKTSSEWRVYKSWNRKRYNK